MGKNKIMKKSHDAVIERFRKMFPMEPYNGFWKSQSQRSRVEYFIFDEIKQARLEGCKHKKTDYECLCFKDGFDTADAENGFNAKQMAKEARLEGAREENYHMQMQSKQVGIMLLLKKLLSVLRNYLP